jgi:hypothetical protein
MNKVDNTDFGQDSLASLNLHVLFLKIGLLFPSHRIAVRIKGEKPIEGVLHCLLQSRHIINEIISLLGG